MCLTRSYDLVAYISPDGALDGRCKKMEAFLFSCVVFNTKAGRSSTGTTRRLCPRFQEQEKYDFQK